MAICILSVCEIVLNGKSKVGLVSIWLPINQVIRFSLPLIISYVEAERTQIRVRCGNGCQQTSESRASGLGFHF